jgi:rhamnogalacturonyl hydrolase YesR
MNTNYEKVKTAMLAIQRYPWEQGVCAQAMLEASGTDESATATFIAMAHDAVLRQSADGRLAVITNNISVTDPAANGEAVWRAYEHTGDDFYRKAAESMLAYLMEKAPRTAEGLICHNDISFEEEFSPYQIWADSCYMLPPFLAVMKQYDESRKQLDGYLECLTDPKTGLLFHIYDAGNGKDAPGKFVSKKLWATGNGWALLGIARVIELLTEAGVDSAEYALRGCDLLDSMLKYRCDNGMFRNTLDKPDTFEDGTSAMMSAVFIYKGIANGWLERDYLELAETVYRNIQDKIDPFGIIRGVCGCPHFNSIGTSAEAQAAYIMMEVSRRKLNET